MPCFPSSERRKLHSLQCCYDEVRCQHAKPFYWLLVTMYLTRNGKADSSANNATARKFQTSSSCGPNPYPIRGSVQKRRQCIRGKEATNNSSHRLLVMRHMDVEQVKSRKQELTRELRAKKSQERCGRWMISRLQLLREAFGVIL